MKSKIVISLTGHRPDKLDGYELHGSMFYKQLFIDLCNCIDYLIDKYNTIECHSGMALGADTIWAYSILYMKNKYPNRIIFVADVPFTKQSGKWPPKSKATYDMLLSHADKKILYSDEYIGPACMMMRNQGMVDAADVLIAIWDGSKGGTSSAVKMAEKKKIPIHRITPDSIWNSINKG